MRNHTGRVISGMQQCVGELLAFQCKRPGLHYSTQSLSPVPGLKLMLFRMLMTEVSVSFLEALQTRRLAFALVNPFAKQLPG